MTLKDFEDLLNNNSIEKVYDIINTRNIQSIELHQIQLFELKAKYKKDLKIITIEYLDQIKLIKDRINNYD